jgi:AcrR family transcriptional regulator
MTMTPAGQPGRHRSDGDRTHQAILTAATALATTEGLDRLSIGDLAIYLGISKSGLYAHFGSKEALQLATIDMARTIFAAEVVARADGAPSGIASLLALTDGFLAHLDRRIFPGGCFFSAASAEMQNRPGAVKAAIDDFYVYWSGRLRAEVDAAIAAGELPADEDAALLVYEIESHLLHAHASFPASGDTAVLDRSRRAIARRLGVAEKVAATVVAD